MELQVPSWPWGWPVEPPLWASVCPFSLFSPGLSGPFSRPSSTVSRVDRGQQDPQGWQEEPDVQAESFPWTEAVSIIPIHQPFRVLQDHSRAPWRGSAVEVVVDQNNPEYGIKQPV